MDPTKKSDQQALEELQRIDKIQQLEAQRQAYLREPSLPFQERVEKAKELDKQIADLKAKKSSTSSRVVSNKSEKVFTQNYSTYQSRTSGVREKHAQTKPRVVTYQNHTQFRSERGVGATTQFRKKRSPVTNLVNGDARANQQVTGVDLRKYPKADPSQTMLKSLNHSGFTNYKGDEISYYRDKYPEGYRTSNNDRHSERILNRSSQPVQNGNILTRVVESNQKDQMSTSNVKFVDYAGFDKSQLSGSHKIQTNENQTTEIKQSQVVTTTTKRVVRNSQSARSQKSQTESQKGQARTVVLTEERLRNISDEELQRLLAGVRNLTYEELSEAQKKEHDEFYKNGNRVGFFFYSEESQRIMNEHKRRQNLKEEQQIAQDVKLYPYDKRYGKTIIKESNILSPGQIGNIEIKQSIVERSAKKETLEENQKNLRGSYVKTHYRKLGVGAFDSSRRETGNLKKSVRIVRIEDLANASKLDISFDLTGKSRVKLQQVLDKEGNVLREEESSRTMSRILDPRSAGYRTETEYATNTEILKEIKEERRRGTEERRRTEERTTQTERAVQGDIGEILKQDVRDEQIEIKDEDKNENVDNETIGDTIVEENEEEIEENQQLDESKEVEQQVVVAPSTEERENPEEPSDEMKEVKQKMDMVIQELNERNKTLEERSITSEQERLMESFREAIIEQYIQEKSVKSYKSEKIEIRPEIAEKLVDHFVKNYNEESELEPEKKAEIIEEIKKEMILDYLKSETQEGTESQKSQNVEMNKKITKYIKNIIQDENQQDQNQITEKTVEKKEVVETTEVVETIQQQQENYAEERETEAQVTETVEVRKEERSDRESEQQKEETQDQSQTSKGDVVVVSEVAVSERQENVPQDRQVEVTETNMTETKEVREENNTVTEQTTTFTKTVTTEIKNTEVVTQENRKIKENTTEVVQEEKEEEEVKQEVQEKQVENEAVSVAEQELEQRNETLKEPKPLHEERDRTESLQIRQQLREAPAIKLSSDKDLATFDKYEEALSKQQTVEALTERESEQVTAQVSKAQTVKSDVRIETQTQSNTAQVVEQNKSNNQQLEEQSQRSTRSQRSQRSQNSQTSKSLRHAGVRIVRRSQTRKTQNTEESKAKTYHSVRSGASGGVTYSLNQSTTSNRVRYVRKGQDSIDAGIRKVTSERPPQTQFKSHQIRREVTDNINMQKKTVVEKTEITNEREEAEKQEQANSGIKSMLVSKMSQEMANSGIKGLTVAKETKEPVLVEEKVETVKITEHVIEKEKPKMCVYPLEPTKSPIEVVVEPEQPKVCTLNVEVQPENKEEQKQIEAQSESQTDQVEVDQENQEEQKEESKQQSETQLEVTEEKKQKILEFVTQPQKPTVCVYPTEPQPQIETKTITRTEEVTTTEVKTETQVENRGRIVESQIIQPETQNETEETQETEKESVYQTVDLGQENEMQQSRKSYTRVKEGNVIKSSKILSKNYKTEILRSSVKRTEGEWREVDNKVHETITSGEVLNRPSQVREQKVIEYTREKPVIVEKVVEVPYTVIIEKQVPNYIYKNKVNEIYLEKNVEKVVENEVAEIEEVEIENVTQKEKIMEVVEEREVENLKEVEIDVEVVVDKEEIVYVEPKQPEPQPTETVKQSEKVETVHEEAKVDYNEEDIDRISEHSEEGVTIRKVYVRRPKDVYKDEIVEEIREVEKEVYVDKEVIREVIKDMPKEEVKIVEVEEEETVIVKQDKVVDVEKIVEVEKIVKVKVPKIITKKVEKQVEIEMEVIQEVEVPVYRDQEVVVEKIVEVENVIEKEVLKEHDHVEEQEKEEVYQKIIEKERPLEINITKTKPKYKEIPTETYKDVERIVNVNRAEEKVETVNKTRDVRVIKEVEKIRHVPKVVERIVEKEYEQEVIVEVPVERVRVQEKRVPVIVEKYVNVPYKIYKDVPVRREVEKVVEIEVVEENPIIIEDDVESVKEVNVVNQVLAENLEERKKVLESLREQEENLQRELRKSVQRNQELQKETKKKSYHYVGKEENKELRNELTRLHREYRNVIQETTQKQIEEIRENEIVKVVEKKRMDPATVSELKASGVITGETTRYIGRQVLEPNQFEELKKSTHIREANLEEVEESHREISQRESVRVSEPVVSNGLPPNGNQVKAWDPMAGVHGILQRAQEAENRQESEAQQEFKEDKSPGFQAENQESEKVEEQVLGERLVQNDEVEETAEEEVMTMQGRDENNGNIYPENANQEDNVTTTTTQKNESQQVTTTQQGVTTIRLLVTPC